MFFSYIICNRKNGTLYTGHTDDLVERVHQHKTGFRKGFSADHNCSLLVWYEIHSNREPAFKRERQIKEWRRCWKIELIEKLNPHWFDLYKQISEVEIFDIARVHPAELKIFELTGDGPRLSSG